MYIYFVFAWFLPVWVEKLCTSAFLNIWQQRCMAATLLSAAVVCYHNRNLTTHYCLDMPSNLRPYAFIIDVTCIHCFRSACVGRISGSKLCINVFLNVCPHHQLSPGSEHGSHIVCPHVGSWLSAALLYVNISTHILSLYVKTYTKTYTYTYIYIYTLAVYIYIYSYEVLIFISCLQIRY